MSTGGFAQAEWLPCNILELCCGDHHQTKFTVAGSPMMPQNMPPQQQMGNGQMQQQQHGPGSQQVCKCLVVSVLINSMCEVKSLSTLKHSDQVLVVGKH